MRLWFTLALFALFGMVMLDLKPLGETMTAWTEKARASTLQASIELAQAAHDLSEAMADGGDTPPEVVLLALSEIRDLVDKAVSAVGLDVRVVSRR